MAHGIALAGGPYGKVLGYERPLFFKPDEAGKKDFEDLSKQGISGKARWFNTVEKNIMHMTSFTKYELKSVNRFVVNFFQMLCANNIDKPIGTVVHTGMLNEQVGYENISRIQYFCVLVSFLLFRYFTQRTLRIERMWPSWGHYIYKKTTPFHLNREYHISFGVKIKFNQVKSMVIEILSGEPIYRNGEFCGFFTSTTYGFTLRKQV
ncbi:unnamed protein product [Adineta steineri]|uniref:Uncharacterized protein n=1 Tax=Adineta steineri TaxID=433720 RepID=A0A816BNC2_9BILA|nr:unnamed protein product [Adineta steineri]CAF1611617.1 unnamed protein product [Adineta steineri]